MKFNRLLIAAAVMAVLGGALWWSNKEEEKKALSPVDASPKILVLKEDAIRGIEIQHKDGVATALKREDAGKWSITAPAPLAADAAAVASLTSALSNLSADRVVDENATDLASYGLAPALLTVSVKLADGGSKKVLIGEENPTGNAVYVKVDGDNRLFTMLTGSRNNLDKSSKELREKHLLSFEPDKISRIELTSSKNPMEFGRTGAADWQILKPKPSRADGFQVEELLRKIRDAQMDADQTEEDAKKVSAGFGGAQPVAIAKVTDANGTYTLEVRKAKDDYFGKSSGMAGIYKVTKDLGEAIGKPLDDFRNKKIFDFGFNDPNKIIVTQYDKTRTFEKQGEKWQSDGKTMDSVSVQALVDKLRDMQAVHFVDLGFISPVIELTVVSSDGKKTEKVQICSYAKNFLAKREGDGTLYEIDSTVINDLSGAVAGVREPEPQKPEAKK